LSDVFKACRNIQANIDPLLLTHRLAAPTRRCLAMRQAAEKQTNRRVTMKNITKHTGTLELVQRMKNSRDGNPQFMLAVIEHPEQGLGWRFRTPANSMLAYKAENFIGKKVDVTIGTFRGCATLDSIREAV